MEVTSGVGVFTVDRDIVVRTWDDWLARATGLAPESVLGRSLASLYPELQERGLIDQLRGVIQSGMVAVLAPAFHGHLLACPPLQSSAHFTHMQQHVTITPLRVGPSIEGATVTVEDVTQRMDRERALGAQLKSSDVTLRLRAATAIARDQLGPTISLIDVLGDSDWAVRRAAVEGLANNASEQSREALITALRDHHSDLALLNATLSTIVAAPAKLVAEVQALLKSPDADLRAYAALALGLMNDSSTVPALIQALKDPDANVRFHAIEALGRLRAHTAAEALLTIAAGNDAFTAFAAVDGLGAIGDSSVAPRLLPLLKKPDLREAVANALAGLAHESAAVPLAELLDDPSMAAVPIASALARLHREFERTYHEGDLIANLVRGAVTPAAAQRLLAALSSARDDSVRDVVVVLGWLELEGIDNALGDLLGHPVAGFDAIAALVRRGGTSVDLLIQQLENGDEDTRKPVALALGRIGSPRAVDALVRLLQGPPELVAVSAAALGSIGASEAFEPLAQLLGHEHAAVRQSAVSAINSIGHPDTEQHVNRLLEHESPLIRESAAKIAGYFGFPGCFDHVLKRCDDPDERVRRVAIEHLVLFDDPRAIEALRTAFNADAPGMRAAAARAAAQLSVESASPLLRSAITDVDLWVRYHAIRSLIALRIAGFDDKLIEIANSDPAIPVRSAAIEALGVLGVQRAAPMLAMLTQNEDREIAVPAIEALGGLADADGIRILMRIAAGTKPEHRRAALGSLARCHDVQVVGEICGLALAQAGSATMHDAIDALARTQTAAAASALVDLTRHPACREAAVAALASVGPDAAPALERALRQPDLEVRLAAVDALARMKDPRATALLTRALEDESQRVRVFAAQALARFDLKQRKTRFPRRGAHL